MIEFIIPTYNRPNQLLTVIGSILSQTNSNWKIHVVADAIYPGYENVKNFFLLNENIKFSELSGPHNDWGHTPRNHGLEQIAKNSKAVVFTGADNYYLPTFAEELFYPIATDKKIVATYCNLLHNKKSWNELDAKLEFTKIDCGCFMIITEIAKEFKYGTRVSWEDWVFIEKVIKKYGSDNILKIPRMLYVHN